jgi:predicted ArsR family transcriptional regulator
MAQAHHKDMDTAEEIEELILGGPPYLETEKPFLTMGDIADRLHVTRETVRNNISQVVTHPMIRVDSAGQTKVYWRAYEPGSEWGEHFDDDEIRNQLDEYFDEQEQKLVMSRALWLNKSQEIADHFSNSPESRIEAWDLLIGYFDQLGWAGRVSIAAALGNKPVPDEYSGVADWDQLKTEGDALVDDFAHLRRILYDVPLFESAAGVELEGVVMLQMHDMWLVDQLEEDMTEEEYEELAPSAKDILFAGKTLDRLAVQLHGFDW